MLTCPTVTATGRRYFTNSIPQWNESVEVEAWKVLTADGTLRMRVVLLEMRYDFPKIIRNICK